MKPETIAAILEAEEGERPSSAEVLASRTTWGSGWNDPMLPKDHAPSANRTSMAAAIHAAQKEARQ